MLRGACHRARVRATRWLAMTNESPYALPRPRSSALVAIELEDVGAFADREQACLCVEMQLGAAIGDVEVAHVQLADTFGWRERHLVHLLHGQPLRLIDQ